MDFFVLAERWLRGRPTASLVCVVETRGSVPRHVGARMLVGADGEICSTIGGGRVEAELTSLGAALARGEADGQVVTHHLVRDLAMCCGGSMTFLVERLDDAAAVSHVCSELAARRAVRVTSRIGAALSVAPAAAREPASWDGSSFAETQWPRERAFLFGAGHVAKAVIPVLRATGFEIIVCDDDEIDALEEVEAMADSTVASFEVRDVERALGPLGPSDCALVLTRDHAIDQRLVEQLLGHVGVGYVGLIGSLGKVGRFRKRVLERGTVSAASWDRLSAPIGIDIAAETPAEIAVSIAAELIAWRAEGRRGGA